MSAGAAFLIFKHYNILPDTTEVSLHKNKLTFLIGAEDNVPVTEAFQFFSECVVT
jgi:hypothetical protein